MKILNTAFAMLLLNIGFAQKPSYKSDGIQTANLSESGLYSKKLATLDSLIISNQFQKITSILIARHGKLVYEKYYNDFTDSSLHNTRSATKTITGILIGQAIDKNYIPSENSTVFKYFKEKEPFQNPDIRKNKITIQDLLTMSSLLECDDDNQYSSGNEEKMYLTEDYFKFALNLPIKGFASFATKPQDDPYGRSFSYCTAGVVLLGGVLEKSTKMKVDEFANKYLFGPLGINKVKWEITPMGMPMTGGGLGLTSRDFIKLGLLYNNKGVWNGKQLISEGWINKSIAPHTNARDGVDYGYLWWLQQFGSDKNKYPAYYMAGNGGTKIAVFPGLDMIVVITSNWYGTIKAHQQSEKILSEYIIPSVIQN